VYQRNTLKLFRTSINIAVRSEKKTIAPKEKPLKARKRTTNRLNLSFRPKVDSPDGSMPGLTLPGSPDVYLSFFTPEKRIKGISVKRQ